MLFWVYEYKTENWSQLVIRYNSTVEAVGLSCHLFSTSQSTLFFSSSLTCCKKPFSPSATVFGLAKPYLLYEYLVGTYIGEYVAKTSTTRLLHAFYTHKLCALGRKLSPQKAHFPLSWYTMSAVHKCPTPIQFFQTKYCCANFGN